MENNKQKRARTTNPTAIRKTLGVQVSQKMWERIPRHKNGRLDQEWLRGAISRAFISDGSSVQED